MSHEDLDQLVERLRIECEALPNSDAATQERLNGLLSELEHRLAHPREDNQDEELLERIGQTIETFEAEHPRATGILNNIMVTLAGMGI